LAFGKKIPELFIIFRKINSGISRVQEENDMMQEELTYFSLHKSCECLSK